MDALGLTTKHNLVLERLYHPKRPERLMPMEIAEIIWRKPTESIHQNFTRTVAEFMTPLNEP